jgi:hypothetical protein
MPCFILASCLGSVVLLYRPSILTASAPPGNPVSPQSALLDADLALLLE